jgi:hypothetical protein
MKRITIEPQVEDYSQLMTVFFRFHISGRPLHLSFFCCVAQDISMFNGEIWLL